MNDDMARAAADIPSGLFVVVVKDSKTNIIDGFLASWVQQVSFEPLLVSIAMKPERNVHDLISSGAIFSLNVVGEDKKDFMKYFWSGYEKDKNPFNHLSYKESDEGAIILEDAKSVMVCRKNKILSPGDHSLVIAQIINSYEQNENVETFVHRRKKGLEY